MGVKGAHVTLGHDQVRETVGLPGTRTSADRTMAHGEPRGATQALTVSQRSWQAWLAMLMRIGWWLTTR
jgi:hypothetical protein